MSSARTVCCNHGASEGCAFPVSCYPLLLRLCVLSLLSTPVACPSLRTVGFVERPRPPLRPSALAACNPSRDPFDSSPAKNLVQNDGCLDEEVNGWGLERRGTAEGRHPGSSSIAGDAVEYTTPSVPLSGDPSLREATATTAPHSVFRGCCPIRIRPSTQGPLTEAALPEPLRCANPTYRFLQTAEHA